MELEGGENGLSNVLKALVTFLYLSFMPVVWPEAEKKASKCKGNLLTNCGIQFVVWKCYLTPATKQMLSNMCDSA